jgi:hypothetical protein
MPDLVENPYPADVAVKYTNASGSWEYVPLTDEENAEMAALRAASAVDFTMTRDARNGYLFSSDWTQGADAPLSAEKVAEWATYRQALRDYPATSSDGTVLGLPDWPTPPE